MPIEKLRMVVLASLMAALTAVGAYIYVPIGPVPIILSTLFVILSGLLLGSRWGLTSMALYLLVGAIGLPVFSEGKGDSPILWVLQGDTFLVTSLPHGSQVSYRNGHGVE